MGRTKGGKWSEEQKARHRITMKSAYRRKKRAAQAPLSAPVVTPRVNASNDAQAQPVGLLAWFKSIWLNLAGGRA